MLLMVLFLATLMTIVWFILMSMVSEDDWITAAYNKVLDNLTTIEKLRTKDAVKRDKLAVYHGVSARIMRLFLGGNSNKEISKLEDQNKQLQNGNLKYVSLLYMPGYVLYRKFEFIARGHLNKTVLAVNQEVYGRMHAENKTKHLIAKLLSYPIIGVAATLILGATAMALGNTREGLILIGVGSALVLVFSYAVYDEVGDLANKRREAIGRQFPNVVSKLALLVTSGMIMDRAWRETADSHDLELYREMKKTSLELDNLVSPEEAYDAFIKRCNTKETTKLASAIMQNLSKGNAEIGALLKSLAKEAWQERKHLAKRDSEKAKSKLMIPTMLLFIAILVMIMIPVAMTFSGF